jgi:hypothetical protein
MTQVMVLLHIMTTGSSLTFCQVNISEIARACREADMAELARLSKINNVDWTSEVKPTLHN